MIHTRKLSIACPQCGSGDVFYSCTPNCCFNHVCAECGTTFEPETAATGRFVSGVVPPDPLPEAADPTADVPSIDRTSIPVIRRGSMAVSRPLCPVLLDFSPAHPVTP